MKYSTIQYRIVFHLLSRWKLLSKLHNALIPFSGSKFVYNWLEMWQESMNFLTWLVILPIYLVLNCLSFILPISIYNIQLLKPEWKCFDVSFRLFFDGFLTELSLYSIYSTGGSKLLYSKRFKKTQKIMYKS